MRLIFSDPLYDSTDRSQEEFMAELKSSIEGLDKENKIQSGDIGRGADLPVIFVEFMNLNWDSVWIIAEGVFAIFIGIPASKDAWGKWVTFAKKIKALIKKQPPCRIDQEAAVILALAEFSKFTNDFSDLEVRVNSIQTSHMPCEIPEEIFNLSLVSKDWIWLGAFKSNGELAFNFKQKRN